MKQPALPATWGAIVLCGGASRRMGAAKHGLMFGEKTSLERILDQLTGITRQIVVVGSADQTLELPPRFQDVMYARDRRSGCGPLEGWATGWSALSKETGRAIVVSCDLPFLSARVISKLLSALDGWDAVAPFDEGRAHPLCAVYSRVAQVEAERMLQQRQHRMHSLLQRIRTRFVAVERFRDVDPDLHSFRNINTPEEYEAAVAELGA